MKILQSGSFRAQSQDFLSDTNDRDPHTADTAIFLQHPLRGSAANTTRSKTAILNF
jgi:hypothetical protein